jgi:hypothetical protein
VQTAYVQAAYVQAAHQLPVCNPQGVKVSRQIKAHWRQKTARADACAGRFNLALFWRMAHDDWLAG